MQANAIRTDKYLDTIEIQTLLTNVEFIIMATPAPEKFTDTPIHFSIFLNTQEPLPAEVISPVFEKFLEENAISNPAELMNGLMSVGFGVGSHDTPMPMLLIKPQDRATIPHATMYVFDFLADSQEFNEAKEKKLTGWSYSYNS